MATFTVTSDINIDSIQSATFAVTAATSVSTTATITTSGNHGLSIGQAIVVSGITPTEYNGTYIVAATTSTTLVYTFVGGVGAGTVFGSVYAIPVSGDALVINNGAIVTCNTDQTVYWSTVTVNNGKLLISNSSTVSAIKFITGQLNNSGNSADRTITLANGLATFEGAGNYIEIGTGSGVASQSMTLPSSIYYAAIEVETAAGSGIYEHWLNAGESPTQNMFGTWPGLTGCANDTRGKFFTQLATDPADLEMAGNHTDLFSSTIVFGDDVMGAKVPTGAKVRVPNIIITDVSSRSKYQDADYRGAKFAMSGGGRFIADKCNFFDSYLNAAQSQVCTITNCVFAIRPAISECYALTIDNVAIGLGINWPYCTTYTAISLSITLTSASTTATATVNRNHGLTTGMYVTIAGATPTAYNGTYVITVTGATTFTYTFAGGTSPATGTITAVDARRVTSLTSSGTTATATSIAHGLEVGDTVLISGASPAAYNRDPVRVDSVTADTFTYTFAGGTSPATGTITYQRYQWRTNREHDTGYRMTWTQVSGAVINKLTCGNWTLESPGNQASTQVPVLTLTYANGAEVSNCRFYNMWRHKSWNFGLRLNLTVGATVSNCQFISCGVNLSTSSNNTFTDSKYSAWMFDTGRFSNNFSSSRICIAYDPATGDKLVNGTRYYVRLVDKRGHHKYDFDSNNGSITSRVFSATPYSAPTNHPYWFGATPGDNQVVLRWPRREPAPTSGTRYEIYRSTAWGTLGSVVSTITTLQTTQTNGADSYIELFNDTTAVNGNIYFYTLRKYDSAGVYTDSAQQEARPVANSSWQNLCLQSNDFSNASWSKPAVLVSTNSTRAPSDQAWSNTGSSADSLTPYANDSKVEQVIATTAGQTYTFSVMLRLSDTVPMGPPSTTLNIECSDNGSSPQTVTQSCVLTPTWARYSVTITTSAGSTNTTVRIGGSNTWKKYANIFAADATFIVGSSPGPIIPTTTTTATSTDTEWLTLNVLTTNANNEGGITACCKDGGQQIMLLLGTAPTNSTGGRWFEIHVSTDASFTPNRSTLAWHNFTNASNAESNSPLFRLDTGSNNNVFRGLTQIGKAGFSHSIITLFSSNNNKFIGFSLNARGGYVRYIDYSSVDTANDTLLYDFDLNGVKIYPRTNSFTSIPTNNTNASSGLTLQNIRSDTMYDWPSSSTTLNTIFKGVVGTKTEPLMNSLLTSINPTTNITTNINTSYTTVYDYIFHEFYESPTLGNLTILMNDSTKDIKPYTVLSGAPRFQNDGSLLFGTAGDSIEWEWPHKIYGVSGFRDQDLGTLVGSTCYIGNAPYVNAMGDPTSGMGSRTLGVMKIEYALDTGSGYGSFKRLNSANLVPESVSAATGFKIKVRMTAMQTIVFSGQSTAFVLGETINGQTSGATAVIDEIVDNGATGHLWVSSVTGTWAGAENIRSGATVRAVTVASPNHLLPIQSQAANNTRVGSLRIFTTIDQNEKYPETQGSLTLTGLPINTEVRVYDEADMSELGGIENTSTGEFTLNYDYFGIDISATIVVFALGYQAFRLENFTLDGTAVSIPISLVVDRQYNNPT